LRILSIERVYRTIEKIPLSLLPSLVSQSVAGPKLKMIKYFGQLRVKLVEGFLSEQICPEQKRETAETTLLCTTFGAAQSRELFEISLQRAEQKLQRNH
jgi:hypothetical protein